jgi:hypothetical protein
MATANNHSEAFTMRRVAGAVWVLSAELSLERASTLAKNSVEIRVATQAKRKMMTEIDIPGNHSTIAPSACSIRLVMEFDMLSLADRVTANWARA